MEYDYIKCMLNNEQWEKFLKLDTEKKYECVEDRQSGDFAVGVIESVQGWVATALCWIDSDGCIDDDQVFINHLLEGGEDAIRSIDEFWDITIE